MKRFLVVFTCFFIWACSQNASKQESSSYWHYQPQNFSAQTDYHAKQIVNGYQDLLKGFANRDTLMIKENSIGLAKLTDSLSKLTMSTDKNVQKNWENSLQNIGAELQGVFISNAENNSKELKMSMNMTGIQILDLLSNIGYKENSIYIFNAQDDQFEDGLIWFGTQKMSANPYEMKVGKEMQATSMLQELK